MSIKKKIIPIDFLIDDIGVDSYFFHNSLVVYVVQNKFLRLSKGLFRENYSSKYFTFEPSIEYQSFKLTAELNLSRKKFLFILEILKVIKKLCDNISKSLFIPYLPKFESTSLQTYLFLRFNDFQSSKSCLFRFGVRLPEICFQKLINFGLLSQIYIKIKELDYLLKHQQFLFDYIQQIQLT